MKNFSMPEQISSTLELDESKRLKHSLEETVSKELIETIMAELPLTINSTSKIRTE